MKLLVKMLARQIDRTGIFARLGRTVESIYGDERVTGVVLDDGTTLSTDLVVLACGVRPRVDTARASGLPVNKGILVNDTWRPRCRVCTRLASAPSIAARFTASSRPSGSKQRCWRTCSPGNRKIATAVRSCTRGSRWPGVDVASMGVLAPELERDEVVQIVEERRDCYRKLIVRDGKLVGAMLVGNTAATAALVQLFDRGDTVPEDPLELLCLGRAAPPAGERVRLQLQQGPPSRPCVMPSLRARTR